MKQREALESVLQLSPNRLNIKTQTLANKNFSAPSRTRDWIPTLVMKAVIFKTITELRGGRARTNKNATELSFLFKLPFFLGSGLTWWL